jgi:hypothetical protein
MDDFDINTALDWGLGGGNFWTVNFGGGLWKNSNGDNPDFFLFEYGGSQTPDIAAILPGGEFGQTVTIPDQWVDLGYTRVAAVSGDPVSGSGNGQSLEGMSWAITDLLDSSGNPLTNDSVIMGISIIDRNGVDPVGFFAVMPPPVQARNPDPADEATDVPRDASLGWESGQSAKTHDVYFGTVFTDVNDASRTDPRGVLLSQGQATNTFDPPGLLEFGQTYYWRVDEVSDPPDSTIFRGDVWSFTAEPFAYPIENITATASSSHADKGPENTINGSGLDDSGLLHGAEPESMWLSGAAGPQPSWIEFQFDKVYKLYEIWVWNSNEAWEPTLGLGFKDVSIEYSVNGTDYTTLGTTHEFARASGAADYAHNTIVDFGGATAKYVRLTANSNWGGMLNQYGLSEVRFLFIPVRAREPSPDSGAIDVDPDVALSWRAGREAAQHDVYISADEQAVIDGTAPVTTVSLAQHGPLSVDLAQTYYWKVNEVNTSETPTTWEGDVWNFATREFLVVDDFESYNDLDPADPESRRIFNIWKDGYDVPTNGALVGYDNPPFCEQTIVHGGKQSMPLSYDNTGTAAYSEAELPLSPAQDWTKHGITALVLWFYGDPGNASADQMYVKLNGVKVPYPGDVADISKPIWKQWNIDLAVLGIDLSNVTQLSIGFERTGVSGGSGTVFIDDILLYRLAPSVVTEEIWLEAESAKTIGASWRMYDDPGASGGRYIGSDDGDGDDNSDPPGAQWFATYDFAVAGGVYKILARIITAPGNSFWVRIPGATSPQITRGDGWVNTNPMDGGDTWHWDEIHNDQQDDNVVHFTLSAGQHTLEIAKREDGAKLDAVLITDQLD